MGPRQFYAEVVLPNVNELVENSCSMRLAFNAVASVDALAAHLYVWCQANAPAEVASLKDDTHYKDLLAKRSVDFALVRGVANVQKHIELIRGKTPKEISSLKQVRRRYVGASFEGWGDTWGRAWGAQRQVVVRTNAGHVNIARDFVVAASRYLEAEMMRLNIPSSGART